MAAPAANFDGLARIYRALEFLAFGRDLERARFCFLERLCDSRNILILGEGDGRCLARLIKIAPQARIHCVEASAAMLDRAAKRLAGTADQGRVRFEHADIFSVRLPVSHYDAVVTHFFLDCFPAEKVSALIGRVEASLRPGALWLFADFVLPSRGWARVRARGWLFILYAFFRWQTGLEARALPDSERLLAQAGWSPRAARTLQRGLVRSAVLARQGLRH